MAKLFLSVSSFHDRKLLDRAAFEKKCDIRFVSHRGRFDIYEVVAWGGRPLTAYQRKEVAFYYRSWRKKSFFR